MRIYLITLILFSFSISLFGQSYYSIDSAVIVYSDVNRNPDLNKLPFILTENYDNDFNKVRAIYTWIAYNIHYDYTGRDKGYWHNFKTDDVIIKKTFQRRNGICACYARLFKYMLSKIQIESVVIEGYARNSDYVSGMPIAEVNHDWNAVKINEKWYLFDVTWASCTWRDPYCRDFNFLSEPTKFVACHFPSDSQWFLMPNPPKKSDFDHYPYVSENYFKLGCQGFPKEGFILSKYGSFIVMHESLNKKDISYKYYIRPDDASASEWRLCDVISIKTVDKLEEVQIKLKDKGSYILGVCSYNEKDNLSNFLVFYKVNY